MSELKTKVSNTELAGIKSPKVLEIMKTIRAIQTRMKQPDIVNAEFITVYKVITEEFEQFSNRYVSIFNKVIRGENLTTVASVLYYWDQFLRGLITEEELSEMLATKYLPPELKAQSDAILAKQKAGINV